MLPGAGKEEWCRKTKLVSPGVNSRSPTAWYLPVVREEGRGGPASCPGAEGASLVNTCCGVFYCTRAVVKEQLSNFDINVLLRKVHKTHLCTQPQMSTTSKVPDTFCLIKASLLWSNVLPIPVNLVLFPPGSKQNQTRLGSGAELTVSGE